MPTLNKTISQLNQLLMTCHDEQRGFEDFARTAEDPDLKTLFASRAREWGTAGEQLEALIQGYGGRPGHHSSLGGELHRGWQGLKSLVGVNDGRAMLDECLRGETLARRQYEAVLQSELAPPVRGCVGGQYELLLDRQAQLRALLATESGARQG